MIFGTKNELDKLAQREIELADRKGAATARLATAEHQAGEAVVTGDAEKEIESVSRLNAEINAIDIAIHTLRSRRPAVIMAANQAAAKKLRGEVADKQAALGTLMAKTGKLLVLLGELENVRYDHGILNLQASSDLGIGGGVEQTKSDLLKVEIGALMEKADRLEVAPMPGYGWIDIETTDSAKILAAVLAHPSEGPSAEAVLTWLAEAANSNRLPSRNFGDMQRRVRIEWNGGVIDRAASVVTVTGVTKRTSARDDAGFDTASGEFRAAA